MLLVSKLNLLHLSLGDISWDEIVKGQSGKYAGTTFGEISNNGKVSGSS